MALSWNEIGTPLLTDHEVGVCVSTITHKWILPISGSANAYPANGFSNF
jgi:hypothetical protein